MIRFAAGIREFCEKKGGAERYLVNLCRQLAGNDFEVHIYTEKWDMEDSKIHFHKVKSTPVPKSLRFLSFAVRATKEIEKGGYDIVFGVGNTLRADVLQPHGGVHWAWFWRSLRAYENPVSWLVKFLGRIFSSKQWVSGWIEDSSYRGKDLFRIVAISDMVKQDILQWYGVSEDKITVVYNGVDLDRFHPRNRRFREEVRKQHGIGNEAVILFISNNFRMKGLDCLMKALRNIKKKGSPPFKLLILGRDKQGFYLRFSKRMGIGEEVVFGGSTDEPEKYYGAADLLVHPTFYDACSLTVLEALASGLPVITTRSNGAGGIMTMGKEGFVISDSRDYQTLGEKLSFFLNSEAREKASVAARQIAEQHSLEKNLGEMKRVFQSRISERTRRA